MVNIRLNGQDYLGVNKVVLPTTAGGTAEFSEGSGGGIEEISTSAGMDAVLLEENVGKIYKFTGTTNSSYVNGDFYEVEDVGNNNYRFIRHLKITAYFNYKENSVTGLSNISNALYNDGQLVDLVLPDSCSIIDIEYTQKTYNRLYNLEDDWYGYDYEDDGGSRYDSFTCEVDGTTYHVPEQTSWTEFVSLFASESSGGSGSGSGSVELSKPLTVTLATKKYKDYGNITITNIGNNAFYGKSKIRSISFPTSITSIKESAFSSCSGLTSLTIPNHITSIDKYAFSNCNGLASVTIPGTLETISPYTFQNCSNLTSVVINEGVKNILGGCFYNCSNLTSLQIPNSIEQFGGQVFGNNSNMSYNIYDNAKYLGNSTNPYLVLVKATNTSIASCTIHPNCKLITPSAFYACLNLTSITIPDSVTSIGDHAFFSCKNLTSLTLGSNLKTIGINAFYGCSGLTSIIIPNTVTSIGYGAFSSCNNIATLAVDGSNTVYHSSNNCIIETENNTLVQGCKNSVIPTDGSVTIIGRSAFTSCTDLTSITIPNTVTTICEGAFFAIGASSIIIPSSVILVEADAFGFSSLTSITFLSTTPPTITRSPFGDVNSTSYRNLGIYVPASSVDTYKTTKNWKSYANKIQAIS